MTAACSYELMAAAKRAMSSLMHVKTLNWLPTEEEKPVSLQRPMEIACSIGWKAHPTEASVDTITQVRGSCPSDEAIAATK